MRPCCIASFVLAEYSAWFEEPNNYICALERVCFPVMVPIKAVPYVITLVFLRKNRLRRSGFIWGFLTGMGAFVGTMYPLPTMSSDSMAPPWFAWLCFMVLASPDVVLMVLAAFLPMPCVSGSVCQGGNSGRPWGRVDLRGGPGAKGRSPSGLGQRPERFSHAEPAGERRDVSDLMNAQREVGQAEIRSALNPASLGCARCRQSCAWSWRVRAYRHAAETNDKQDGDSDSRSLKGFQELFSRYLNLRADRP